MARGNPGAWSVAFGVPFVAIGVYVLAFQESFQLTANQPTAPPAAGAGLALFGAFVVAFGLYVQFIAAPEPPTMREDEEILEEREPAQRNAIARTAIGVPFLLLGIYLLYFTRLPYIYPTLALGIGFYVFTRGLYTYYENTLTTYIVTNERVIVEYRFLSLVRNEVPLDKVRGVEERRSVFDSLFGVGDVSVLSGESPGLSLFMRSISDPTEFADAVRRQI